jgi:hypothetical protein
MFVILSRAQSAKSKAPHLSLEEAPACVASQSCKARSRLSHKPRYTKTVLTPNLTRWHRLYHSLIALAIAVTAVSVVLTSGMLYHYGLEGWYGDFLFVLFSLGSFALFEWILALPFLLIPTAPHKIALFAACAIGPIVFTAMRLSTHEPYSPLALSSPKRIFFTALLISILTAAIYFRLVRRSQRTHT